MTRAAQCTQNINTRYRRKAVMLAEETLHESLVPQTLLRSSFLFYFSFKPTVLGDFFLGLGTRPEMSMIVPALVPIRNTSTEWN